MKALTWVLEEVLPVSRLCVHVRGHGGAKAAVRAVVEHLPWNSFVFRTDVRGYYDAIDHRLLLDRLERYVSARGFPSSSDRTCRSGGSQATSPGSGSTCGGGCGGPGQVCPKGLRRQSDGRCEPLRHGPADRDQLYM